MCELNDVLAEIRFDYLHARRFKRIVQVRLFSRHALAFDNRARTAIASEFADDRVCFGRINRPVDHRAALLGVRDERLEIAIQVQQRFVFDCARVSAQIFPVAQSGRGFESLFAEQRRRVTKGAAQLNVRQCGLRILAKRFAAEVIHESVVREASNSARCMTFTLDPLRESRPPICIKQLASPDTTACTPERSIASIF